MTASPHPRTERRRRLGLTVLIVAAVLAVAGVLSAVLRTTTGTAPPTSTPTPTTEPGADPLRPAVHLTPEQHWMNDPQRPFLLDGVWHYYYLYNADYPDENGTAWYHATSTDLVHWRDEGIAIDKYTTGLGDIWTGTAVVDAANTAGFGAGAVVAVVTQQSDGVQRQSLFVSQDGGYSFSPYDGNPVMDNPGTRDFRDPRVIWDDASRRWVMLLAEGDKIGFYTSPDLKSWTYVSAFSTDALGVLECPDLFPMSVDGDPSRVRWVLAAGANGASEGMTTGTVYWTGDFDGESFTADTPAHRWLDRGADYYASVTWSDPRLSDEDQLAERLGIGWLNNWSYAALLPAGAWQGGSASVVRSIRLVDGPDGPVLESTPIAALEELEEEATTHDDLVVAPDGDGAALAGTDEGAYRITVTAAAATADSELRLRIPRGDGAFATVGYDFAAQRVFVARDADAIAADMPDEYRAIRSAALPIGDGGIQLDVIVDAGSIEVFAGDGAASLSMVSYGPDPNGDVIAEAARGTVTLTDARIAALRAAPVERVADR